jgi:hypothetical protein
MDNETRKNVVFKSIRKNTITLMTKAYGRGTGMRELVSVVKSRNLVVGCCTATVSVDMPKNVTNQRTQHKLFLNKISHFDHLLMITSSHITDLIFS